MENKELKVLHYGTVELGDRVKVSDPCYGIDVWCSHILDKVKPGIWDCYIILGGEFNERVAFLVMCKDGYQFSLPKKCEPADIGVDSGTCGIYDLEYYKEYHGGDDHDVKWYDDNVLSWCMNDKAFICTGGKGFVSDSGYGDGSYYLLVDRDEYGDAISIAIDFCVENAFDSEFEFIER